MPEAETFNLERTAMTDKELKALALLGATQRIKDIDTERAMIVKAFPAADMPKLGPIVKVTVRAAKASRLHWTQTPAGKRKMARIQRAAWKARRRASKG